VRPRQRQQRSSSERVSRKGNTYEQRTKSRSHGEGSIYFQESSHLWRASVTLATGKRKYLSGKSRQDVARKLGAVLRDLQLGINPPDERQMVGQWLHQYLDGLEAQRVSHGTLVRYRGVVRNYLEPQLGRIRLSQLQPQHVKTYQDGLSRRGFSPSTITIHRTLLGGALKQAVAFGLIPRNVVSLVKPPKDSRESKGRTLTPEDARALLNAVQGDRLEALYMVLLTAGLRRGEALGLRWSDLELDGPNGAELRVRQQLQWPHGKPTLVAVKSRKGMRSIPLPQMTVQSLVDRRERQISEYQLIGENVSQHVGLVFNAEDGAPLHRNTMVKQFHARVQAAGIGYLRPHDLRHTYGSLLMSQGVPLKTISELLGHASIEVTADVYLHSLDVQVRDTARSVEKALAEPTRPRHGVCPMCGTPLHHDGTLESGTGHSLNEPHPACGSDLGQSIAATTPLSITLTPHSPAPGPGELGP
jgi:integrase